MFVVDAPPFMEKSPLVIVEEALDRKPLENVARPVDVSVELRLSVLEVNAPMVASCENRFVELAVVENRLVVVAFASVVFPFTVRWPLNRDVATEDVAMKFAASKYDVRCPLPVMSRM